ncbi:MAG: DUF192 domain-containing protein [Henriciella sp.]|nr:DUF192 domain-containing protein [Henriciella sp.]
MMKKALYALAALTVSFTPVAMADPMEGTPLTIQTGGARLTFSVGIANDPDEISYGLMNRESMDADKGMLFDFAQPRDPAMFMKDTLIPLDMLFISVDGKIEMIARNAVPGSLRTISAGIPVKAVLELNGGLAAELGLQPGDTVIHPIFGNSETDATE